MIFKQEVQTQVCLRKSQAKCVTINLKLQPGEEDNAYFDGA